MWNLKLFRALGAVLLCAALAAQDPDAPEPRPELLPGEALAMSVDEKPARFFGEAAREHPMGSLAKLVWIRLEGEEWASAGVEFKCTGSDGTHSCWLKKGHGRVDVGKALRESCNLAFLSWAKLSATEWKKYIGEGAGRLHLEEGFRPFLGGRMPPGEQIPPMSLEWVGDGELLRTSPEGMLQWLMDPVQATLIATCRRHLTVKIGRDESWWIKTGTAPVPGEPGATSAWVAGGNGQVLAVFHMPRGRGKVEGMERFVKLMGIR